MSYKDPEKMAIYQRKWMQNRRATFFVDKMCVLCGSKEKLELDHIDPAQKKDHRVWSWTKQKMLVELAKCQVLCKECHKRKTIGFLSKPLRHGTNAGYVRGCRCLDCKQAHAKYKKEYRVRTGIH